MTQRFDTALRTFFAERSLSAAQLARLQTLGGERTVAPVGNEYLPGRARHWWYALAGAAATLVLMSGLIAWQTPAVEQRVAREVAENHLRLRPADFQINDFRSLDEHFTQLAFRLQPSGRVTSRDWELVGARYCSILGHTAAQLRLVDPDTRIMHTVYETEYTPDFAGLPDIGTGAQPRHVVLRGLQVEMWVENDHVYAMTLGPETPDAP